jgi:hypothetical protein
MVLPPPIPGRGTSGSNAKEQTKQCKQSTMKKKRDKKVDEVNNSKERKEVVDEGDDEDHDDDVASFVSTLDQMPPEGSGGEEVASFKDVVHEGVNNASLEDGLHNDNMSFSLSVDNDGDDDVEEDDNQSNDLLLMTERTQTGGKSAQASRHTKTGGNRNRNYSELEDILITKAYISVSTDAIHGSQQKGNIFWSKVHQKFKLFASKEPGGNELRGRPVDSLKQRYTKVIAKAVSKYNKFYKTLKNDNKSGWNEEMYMDEASKLYEEEEGRPFRFLSCVEALHKVPKFDPMVSDAAEQSKRVNNCHRPQGASIERPIGSKKAKIVKYLQESGVVLAGGGQIDESNSVSVNTNTTSSIEQLLQNNYQQRERAMKLKRVKIYIELGEREKARKLMRDIEEEENMVDANVVVNNSAGGEDEVPIAIDVTEQPVASMPSLPRRIPMPPGVKAPIREIDIEQGRTFPESQLTEM